MIDLRKHGFEAVKDEHRHYDEWWIRWDENGRRTELKITWGFHVSIDCHAADMEFLTQYVQEKQQMEGKFMLQNQLNYEQCPDPSSKRIKKLTDEVDRLTAEVERLTIENQRLNGVIAAISQYVIDAYNPENEV